MKILATALLLTIALETQAQTQTQTHAQTQAQVEAIRPGDPIIKASLIRPEHSYYKCYAADSLGNITYQWVNDQVTRIDSQARHIIFARTRQVPVGSFSADTSITDLSCKPLSMHEVHYQRDVSFTMTFGETGATVHTVRKGTIQDKTYPMKSGYFEDNMIEYIFGYLDLKKGQTYQLDNFNKDTPAPSDPYTIDYAFDDILAGNGGAHISCRVIHFIHGATTGYIWIDKETRRMIKELGNFKNGLFSITLV